MKHREFEAPEELRDTIKCFWYDCIDLRDHQPSFEVVPDGYTEIIFYFGSTCSIVYNDTMQLLPSPFMMGLLDRPVHFFIENPLEIIGVRCFPWTVFDLLGLPSGKNGVQVFEHPIAQLQFALNEFISNGSIEEAIILVKEYFLNAREHISTDSLLSKAGIAMRKANGTLLVSEIAAEAHATVRTLERKFRQSSGYTVKDVSGLIRFEQVRNQLWFDPDSNLAGLAHELGYTDQSHLSREFKRYSGTTPGAFARKAKKGKQFLSNDFVAFVQS